MAANDAVSMNVAENRQNVPMAIQENRAAVPMTVAEGGGTPGGLNRKADKVTGAVAGNLAGLDANGNLTDSGKAPGDFLEAPATAGSEGQVLTADGEGGASWQDPTGGDPTEIIDDNAGSGDTDKVWSADKSHSLLTEINSMNTATASAVDKALSPKTVTNGKVTEWQFKPINGGSAILNYVTPEEYGAVGDGVTDDSQAVQDAVDAGYAVYFASNKTYYLASTVTIDHDCHLFGGENTVIKTKTPTGGTANYGIVIQGTLKKTTTLTGNYSAVGTSTENAGNRFELTDMSDIDIGDIMVIVATDQYYSYDRQYYYLGGSMLIAEKDSNYLYASDAMPWDIENTANVSVKIYDAPVAKIENLKFVSDNDTSGSYIYCVELLYCKNSEVRNCTITEMDNGIELYECVNTLVDCVNVSKSSGVNESPLKDHYGIAIYSCTNTIVSRVTSECANSCVDLSGTIPNMNTYIRNCNLFGSNRVDGLGMHENAYNTVVEDCVLGGMIGYGTMYVNRCRFVQRNKLPDSNIAISFRGSHKPEWAKLTVRDCEIEGSNLQVYLANPAPQNPIQSFDHVFGEIIIQNCSGGMLYYNPSTSQTVLSNTIIRLVLDNWRNCYEIYHAGGIIKNMLVKDCSFGHNLWINDHHSNICFTDIEYCHLVSDNPKKDRIFVNSVKGGRFNLPNNVNVDFSSDDNTAHYVICGKNIGSNKPDDYSVGSVNGTLGNQINRTINPTYANAVSVNGSGELIFECKDTSAVSLYPKCFLYVDEAKNCTISCKLKNTGETAGAAFRVSIAVMNADTKKIIANSQATAVQATADGAEATITRTIPANSLVQFYILCSSSVQNAETTLEDLLISAYPTDMNQPEYGKYKGVKRDGDGTLKTVSGINNIMSSVYDFIASFKHDFEDVAVTSGGGGGGGACTSITLSQGAYNLSNYDPVTVGYTVVPADTSDEVMWASSDPNIFTVDDGVITAKGLGSATLTVTCGQQTATATINTTLPYLPNYLFSYVDKVTNHGRFTENYTRILAYGYGEQKATFGIIKNDNSELINPVLLPKNTSAIKISIASDKNTMVYNGSENLFVYWFTDEYCEDGSTYVGCAKCLEEQRYNIRSDISETISVPTGANAVCVYVRTASTYTSENDPETVMDTLGFTIEFLQSVGE